MTPPVLFLVFNRPDLSFRSFEVLRKAKPSKLFIAADGPRPDRNEESLCEECRSIVNLIDWDCEFYTLFRDENLGCKLAVSQAIDWFFSHVEEGIILEDDCVPDQTFFRFCEEMLDKYRFDSRVMCITGNTFQPSPTTLVNSYYFSIYSHIWGWATWRRAWRLYDRGMTGWNRTKEEQFLSGFLRSRLNRFWEQAFDGVVANQIDTWDYAWLFTCWSNSGLTITPKINLVSNIGFDERASHTTDSNSTLANLPFGQMDLPLNHPNQVVRNVSADWHVEDTLFCPAHPHKLNKRRSEISRWLSFFLQK